ncbi:hypothetical protein E8E95_02200 [Pseudomonas sp. BN414]|nr:hypothetical protein [Pseudomonas sp. BN414]MDH4580815.1 hypothetical protein [Pseudomonas sp. BN415]
MKGQSIVTSLVRTPVFLCGCLMLLTLVSVYSGEIGSVQKGVALLVILIAAVKAQLVIMFYMEARHFPEPWRRLYGSWVYAAASVILVGVYIVP